MGNSHRRQVAALNMNKGVGIPPHLLHWKQLLNADDVNGTELGDLLRDDRPDSSNLMA